jgi:hypothetical protein
MVLDEHIGLQICDQHSEPELIEHVVASLQKTFKLH